MAENKYGYSSSKIDGNDSHDSDSIIEFAGKRASANYFSNLSQIIEKPYNVGENVGRLISMASSPLIFGESILGVLGGKYKVPIEEVRGTREYEEKSLIVAGDAIRTLAKRRK